MTTFDWVIAVLVLALAVVGWRKGFIVSFLTLAGLLIGAAVGARLLPAMLSGRISDSYVALLGLWGAVVLALLLSILFQMVGEALRRSMKIPTLGRVDGLLGGLLTAVVGVCLVWIVAAATMQIQDARTLRKLIQRSVILQKVNVVLPPTGPILNLLARFDPLPTFAGPDANVAPPQAAIARDPQVAAAANSVVRVTGSACGFSAEGSGWVVGKELVVTNVHVIAGERDTAVDLPGKTDKLAAKVVYLDTKNDLALLKVPGLNLPSLALAESAIRGRQAAILGYPENGPYSVRAARVGSSQLRASLDAYGNGPVLRRMVAFRGTVKHGNSGGPVINSDGEVIGTVFAMLKQDSPKAGLAVPNSVVRKALDEDLQREVGSGPCAG